MGEVVDLRARRPNDKKKSKPATSRMVVCSHCGEKHPIMRLAGGEERFVTAFADGEHWFCRNRGCRAAWMSKQTS